MRRPGRLAGAAAPTMPVAVPRAEAVAAPQERWAGPGRSVFTLSSHHQGIKSMSCVGTLALQISLEYRHLNFIPRAAVAVESSA